MSWIPCSEVGMTIDIDPATISFLSSGMLTLRHCDSVISDFQHCEVCLAVFVVYSFYPLFSSSLWSTIDRVSYFSLPLIQHTKHHVY